MDDNIQEIQIIQSPVHARYGNFSGGVINAITKSGGNEFTGTIRGTFYRTAWSAQAPRGTQPSIGPTNSGTLSSEDEMTRRWTVAIGGPIIKDKLWFSLSTKQDPSIMTPRSFADLRGILMGDGSGAQPLGYNGVTTVNGVTFMAGNAYFSKADTKFYEAKFTYSITPLQQEGRREPPAEQHLRPADARDLFDPERLPHAGLPGHHRQQPHARRPRRQEAQPDRPGWRSGQWQPRPCLLRQRRPLPLQQRHV